MEGYNETFYKNIRDLIGLRLPWKHSDIAEEANGLSPVLGTLIFSKIVSKYCVLDTVADQLYPFHGFTPHFRKTNFGIILQSINMSPKWSLLSPVSWIQFTISHAI
jgi:hypothetical protein